MPVVGVGFFREFGIGEDGGGRGVATELHTIRPGGNAASGPPRATAATPRAKLNGECEGKGPRKGGGGGGVQ